MIGLKQLEIICPRCAAHAVFREPYAFHSGDGAETVHRWGNWHVVERYPELLPWRAPAGSNNQYLTYGESDGDGYALFKEGVVECKACAASFVHALAWPTDAWWQWSIRGQMLWAWDRAHAEQILTYVRAADRPPRPIHGPLGSLPTHFLTAKIRPTVVKVMTRKLSEKA